MGNYDDPVLTGRPGRRRWPVVLGVVVALLVGGGVGYSVRALSTGPPVPVEAPSVAAAPTTAPPPMASCAETAAAGAALVAQLQRAVTAIGNLDPGTLSDVLDQAQRLQGRLENAVRGCTGSAAPQPGG